MAIRKGWVTTPAVAVTKNQDMVHRSIGRAGIVVTGEGTQTVRMMLQEEKKRSERFAPGVPVTEVYVGDGPGQVPLRKLQKHLTKCLRSYLLTRCVKFVHALRLSEECRFQSLRVQCQRVFEFLNARFS